LLQRGKKLQGAVNASQVADGVRSTMPTNAHLQPPSS
jgi:hypothetical protein